MKNITISMDDETAAWARVEAAKAGKSVSRFIGDMLASKRAAPRPTHVDIGQWIGAGKGLFESPAEADAFIRAERERWG
jgi:hypothetical protein